MPTTWWWDIRLLCQSTGICQIANHLLFTESLYMYSMTWHWKDDIISFEKNDWKMMIVKGHSCKKVHCTLYSCEEQSRAIFQSCTIGWHKGCDNFPNVNNKKIMRLAFIIIIVMTKRLVLLTFRRGEEIDWLLLLIEEKIAVVQLLNNCQSADDLTWQARHGKTSQKYFHFLNWRESSQYTKIIWLLYVAIKTLGKKNAAIKSENKIHQSWQKKGGK